MKKDFNTPSKVDSWLVVKVSLVYCILFLGGFNTVLGDCFSLLDEAKNKFRDKEVLLALTSAEEAFHCYEEVNDSTGMARSSAFRIFFFHRDRDTEAALEEAGQIMPFFPYLRKHDLKLHLKIVQLLGEVHQERGDLAVAAVYYQEVVDVYIELDQARQRARVKDFPEEAANALARLGSIQARQGFVEISLDNLDRAQHFVEEMPEALAKSEAQGFIHFTKGNVFRQGRWYAMALSHLKSAEEIFGALGDERWIWDVQNDLALCYSEMGKKDSAIIRAEELLLKEISNAPGWRKNRAVLMDNLSRDYTAIGEFEKAMGLSLRAEAGFDQGHFDLATCFLNRAYLYRKRGDLNSQREMLKKTIAILSDEEVGKTDFLVRAYLELGKGYRQEGNHWMVIESLRMGLGKMHQTLGKTSEPHFEIPFPNISAQLANETQSYYQELGFAFKAMEEESGIPAYLDSAFFYFKNTMELLAVQEGKRLDLGKSSYINDKLWKKQSQLVEGAIRTAFELYQERKQTHYLYSALHFSDVSKAQLLKKRWNEGNGILSKDKFGGGDNMAGLISEIRELQSNTWHISQARNQHTLGTNGLESIQLQLSQLMQYYRESILASPKNLIDYESRNLLNAMDTSKVRQALLHDLKETSFLEYHWGKDRCYAFCLSRNGLQATDIGPVEKLEKLVLSFIAYCTSPVQDSSNSLDGFRNLAQKLIPFSLSEQGTQRLVIVPDGPLAQLSFAALPLQDSGNFLIEEYAISYDHSLEFYLRSRLEADRSQPGRKVVGFFPDNRTDQTCGKVFAFPYGSELEKMRANWNVTVYQNDDATKSQVQKEYSSATILHLGVHGYQESNSVVLSDQYNYLGLKGRFHCSGGSICPVKSTEPVWPIFPKSMKTLLSTHVKSCLSEEADWKLFTFEIYNMKTSKNRLVVLGACESGDGEFLVGEGTQSLARAFRMAGSPTVLSSKWVANISQMQELHRLFYFYLEQGGNLDVALAEAQRSFLAKSASQGHGMEHPYYWAHQTLEGCRRAIHAPTNMWIQ